MKRLHIFNPAAGKGNPPEIIEKSKFSDEEVYITKGVGDAEKIAFEACSKNSDLHLVVYGGDGTINEVANGIIKSGAGDRALFTVVPTGTGNDFVRSFPDEKKIYSIDAIEVNGSYVINSANTGVDSNVVEKASHYKNYPFLSGSLAYMMGALNALFHKIGERWKITLKYPDGTGETFDNEEFSLALFSNGKYYGGGFLSAPLAETDDGLIDAVIVKKVSKPKFISLLNKYKKGLHINRDTKNVAEDFKECMIYKKCISAHIENIKRICLDGEMMYTNSADIRIVKNALRYSVI